MNTSRRSFLTTAGLSVFTSAVASPFHQNNEEGLKMTFAFKAEITLDKPMELGNTQHGNRRIIPITGGSFEGPNIRGKVVAGGYDWQLLRADDVVEIDARYVLQTDGGDLITLKNTGMRHGPPEVMQRLAKGEEVDASAYYFRSIPVFETGSPKHKWLMKSVFIATGMRKPKQVLIDVWRIV